MARLTSAEANIHSKVVVITGATSGIGHAAANILAGRGARLVIVARSPERARSLLDSLPRVGSGIEHRVYFADLCQLTDVHRVGLEIAQAEPRIDILINNAGSIYARRGVNPEGIECTLATNHVSYFVLTHHLRACLSASASARVVNTASVAHRGQTLNFSDLQMEKGYNGLLAYARSKLCNVLFTRELARRLANARVTANCLHPGFIATKLGRRENTPLSYAVRFTLLFGRPPRRGGEALAYLSSSTEVDRMTGQYFDGRRPVPPSNFAQDDLNARRLWSETERLTGLTWE